MNYLLTLMKMVLSCCALLIAGMQVAVAYIGPGGVVSGIGALIALIGAILLAILGFLWFPIKRLLRKRQQAKTENHEPSGAEHSQAELSGQSRAKILPSDAKTAEPLREED